MTIESEKSTKKKPRPPEKNIPRFPFPESESKLIIKTQPVIIKTQSKLWVCG